MEILNRLPADSSLQWARAVIHRQSRHLARLVEDLLDISRITRGKIELRPTRVAITSIIASAIETSQPLIDERGHQFELNLPADVLEVNAIRSVWDRSLPIC